MKISPTQTNFKNRNSYVQYIKLTSYGKCIHGKSMRGYDYDVYVSEDRRTGKIMHKLYYVTKNNEWVKSFLRFFSNNKAYKEIKSESKS
jgi:hypothetical protein